MCQQHTRRNFLTVLASGVGLALIPNRLFATSIHPEPRKGIDASLVMTDEDLSDYSQRVRDIYNMIREIPQIADGIGCHCGCFTRKGYRSLLTCFYKDGIARGCMICQGQAKLAFNRFKEGQSLDQIRRAIDARFG